MERSAATPREPLGEQGNSQNRLAENEAKKRVADAPASTAPPPCSPSGAAANERRCRFCGAVVHEEDGWWLDENGDQVCEDEEGAFGPHDVEEVEANG